jgi:hypothetical protein
MNLEKLNNKWKKIHSDYLDALNDKITIYSKPLMGGVSGNSVAVNGTFDDFTMNNAVSVFAKEYQTAASRTINTGGESGSLSYTVEENGWYWNIVEVADTPGFDVEVTFNLSTGMVGFHLYVLGQYTGDQGHTVNVDAWNGTSWDNVGTIPETAFDDESNFVLKRSHTINDSVKIRFYHVDSGNASHLLKIDEMRMTCNNQEVISHWIFDSVYNSDKNGGSYIGEDWSQSGATYGNNLISSICENDDGYPFDTFENATVSGFHAINSSGGTQNCGTADEISYENDTFYITTFNLSLVSGTLPDVGLATNLGGPYWGRPLTYTCHSGNNVWPFYFTGEIIGTVQFSVDTGSDFTVSNLEIKKVGTGNHILFAGWSGYPDVVSSLIGSNSRYNSGNALKFNGTDEYLWIPKESVENFQSTYSDFTWEMWLKPTTLGSYSLMAKGDGVSGGFSFGLMGGDLNVFVETMQYNFQLNYLAGQEFYLAVQRDGNDLRVFKNDVEIGAGTGTDAFSNNKSIYTYNDLYIGYGINEYNPYSGYISEIRYTSRTLSEQEIEESYGLAKGWTQSDTAPTTLLNASFGQQYKPTGANYFNQSLAVTPLDLYQIQLKAKGAAVNQTYYVQEDDTAITGNVDAPNGVYGTQTSYWKFSSALPDLRIYVADGEDVTFDSITVRQAISGTVNNYSSYYGASLDYLNPKTVSGMGELAYSTKDLYGEIYLNVYGWSFSNAEQLQHLPFGNFQPHDVIFVGLATNVLLNSGDASKGTYFDGADYVLVEKNNTKYSIAGSYEGGLDDLNYYYVLLRRTDKEQITYTT